jgi:hypothetical protein
MCYFVNKYNKATEKPTKGLQPTEHVSSYKVNMEIVRLGQTCLLRHRETQAYSHGGDSFHKWTNIYWCKPFPTYKALFNSVNNDILETLFSFAHECVTHSRPVPRSHDKRRLQNRKLDAKISTNTFSINSLF